MSLAPTQAAAITTVDVRRIDPRDRHTTVLDTFRALAVGTSLDVLSDHDPRPLRYQLDSVAPGAFSWTYLQFGPDSWQVRIHKLAPAHGGGGACCGHCGG